MGIFNNDDVDLSKVKPQPYDSFEEEESKRERDATETNAPLTEEQKRIVRQQEGINIVEQTINDTLKD